MKVCRQCGLEKPVEEYRRGRNECKECSRARSREYHAAHKAECAAAKKAWAEANREKRKADARAYYLAHRAEALAASKEYYTANREKVMATRAICRAKQPGVAAVRTAEWRKANPGRDAANARAYRAANPAKVNALVARREATQLGATPAWANEFFIAEAYDLAARRTKALGFEWHVDHVVPLRSRIVCGLHVENNLAVIPGADNISKGNRFWPDMP